MRLIIAYFIMAVLYALNTLHMIAAFKPPAAVKYLFMQKFAEKNRDDAELGVLNEEKK